MFVTDIANVVITEHQLHIPIQYKSHIFISIIFIAHF